jgi:hypothetical protein
MLFCFRAKNAGEKGLGKTDSIPWMRDLFKLDVYGCRHLPVIFFEMFFLSPNKLPPID